MTQESTGGRHEIADRLTARAASDPAFRRRLVDDPHGAVHDELGVTLPTGVTMTVVEETSDHLFLVLPVTSSGDATSDLSDTQLSGVAGGGSDYITYTLEETGC
ncbi:MAG: NHLP leader peptide family RiPP precursor [Lapillicoccus sp.]